MRMRGRTLIRKTSLLRKINPMMRRSSFTNEDIYNPLIVTMGERRNIPEIVNGCPSNCFARSKPGSISSLRCHRSRMARPKDGPCEVMFSRTKNFWGAIFSISDSIWWSQTGSNRRPHACKARALPAELWPRTRRRMPCVDQG